MEFLSFVMALSPILVVLIGILGFKQSAKKVSPIAFLWTIVLAFTFFNVDRISFADMVKDNPYAANKELLIIPGAVHTDLYDRMDIIPFGRIEAFYHQYLK